MSEVEYDRWVSRAVLYVPSTINLGWWWGKLANTGEETLARKNSEKVFLFCKILRGEAFTLPDLNVICMSVTTHHHLEKRDPVIVTYSYSTHHYLPVYMIYIFYWWYAVSYLEPSSSTPTVQYSIFYSFWTDKRKSLCQFSQFFSKQCVMCVLYLCKNTTKETNQTQNKLKTNSKHKDKDKKDKQKERNKTQT